MFRQGKVKISGLILIQVILSYILITATFYLVIDTHSNLAQLRYSTQELHHVVGGFESIGHFFEQTEDLEMLREFRGWLSNHEQFTFMTYNRQSFYMERDTFPDKFKLIRYGVWKDGWARYRSMQINAAFIEFFGIDVVEGRLFEYYDYDITNEIIPLLLGYEYRNYANIGDYIEFNFWFAELTGEVIGFLERGTYYNNTSNLISLDGYIIMPALELRSQTIPLIRNERFLIGGVYLDNSFGLIASEYPRVAIQEMVTRKSQELNMVSPRMLYTLPPFYLAMWGMEGEQLQALFTFAAIFMIVIAGFSMSINIANKIQQMKRNIAIYVANGMSLNAVRQSIFIYIAFINLLGAVIAALLWLSLTDILYLLPLVIITMVNILIQLIYPYLLVGRLHISKAMNGEG